MESLLTSSTGCNILIGTYVLISVIRSYFWAKTVLRSRLPKGIRFSGCICVIAIWLVAFLVVSISGPLSILHQIIAKLPKAKKLSFGRVYQDIDIEDGWHVEDTSPRSWEGLDLTALRQRIFARDVPF